MALTSAQYLRQLQALLPTGAAWPREDAAALTRLLYSLADELARVDLRADALVEEGDVRTTSELLADWERVLGLPDECTVNETLSVVDRRRLAWAKLAERGGQSRAYFIELAARYGEPDATITEFRQATCNSDCNAALYSQADEFVWRMNVRNFAQGTRLATCNDNCTVALQIYAPNLIECPINARKPAHTKVLFAYDATSHAPADLQPFHTRASTAWAFDAAGVLQEYAVNVLRVVPSPAGIVSALREPESTNKLTTRNANPTVPGAPGGGVVLVDDTAALTAAGLFGVCSSGQVYMLDNSAGGATAWIVFAGTTGNTNPHSFSVYYRSTGGVCILQYSVSGLGPVNLPVSAGYTRAKSQDVVPSSAANSVQIAVPAGAVCWAILQQLEELQFATTPIVNTTGVQIARARDEINIPLSVAAGEAHSEFIDFAMLSGGNAILVSRSTTSDLDVNAARFASDWNGAVGLNSANQYTYLTRGKQAIAADASGRSLCLNGGAVAADANTHAAFTRLMLGQSQPGSDVSAPQLYIHEFRAYRWRLSNVQLQTITT